MMHAEVIDLLCGKGKFSTEEALVLAEAVGIAIEKAQLVTVPILDTRFAAVDKRFAEIDVRFAAVDARFTQVNGRLDRLEGRMEGGFAAVSARIDAQDAKMQRWAVLIILSVVVSQTALGPIGTTAMEGLQKALSTIVH